METRPYVSWELMNDFLVDAFAGYGVPREDAAICADVLLESDRRGIESHGCNRFKPIYIDRIERGTLLSVTNLEVIRETPTTLVLDEPMAGLDPQGRANILALVHQLHNDGMTIVMVSHSMEDVAENVERVLVMDHGKVFMDGTPAEVFSHEKELYTIGLDVPQAAKFRNLLASNGFDVSGDVYTLDGLADAIVAKLGTRTKEQYLSMVAANGEAM